MSKPQQAGRGVIFPNTKKDRGPSEPAYRGAVCCPACREQFRLSAWVKTMGDNSKSPGEKYLNLVLTPAEESFTLKEQAPTESSEPSDDQKF